jgi:hypothetical protein
MLPLYRSAVNCSSSNVEGNFINKIIYGYYFHFQVWNLCSYLKDLPSPKQGKGKAIPLQAWTGPEGSRRLRLPDFKKIGT